MQGPPVRSAATALRSRVSEAIYALRDRLRRDIGAPLARGSRLVMATVTAGHNYDESVRLAVSKWIALDLTGS